MHFISFSVGDLTVAEQLPRHLEKLYGTISHANIQCDPEICAELEPVPIKELLEPFSSSENFVQEAISAVERQILALAAAVVAVYTVQLPEEADLCPPDCQLRYIGTSPEI